MIAHAPVANEYALMSRIRPAAAALSLVLGFLAIIPAFMSVLVWENIMAEWQGAPRPNRKIAENQGLVLLLIVLFLAPLVAAFIGFVGTMIRKGHSAKRSSWIIATFLFIGPSLISLTLLLMLPAIT